MGDQARGRIGGSNKGSDRGVRGRVGLGAGVVVYRYNGGCQCSTLMMPMGGFIFSALKIHYKFCIEWKNMFSLSTCINL